MSDCRVERVSVGTSHDHSLKTVDSGYWRDKYAGLVMKCVPLVEDDVIKQDMLVEANVNLVLGLDRSERNRQLGYSPLTTPV